MKSLQDFHDEYFTDLKLYPYDAEDDNRYQDVHDELYKELMMHPGLDFKDEVCDIGRCLTRGDVDEAWNKLENYLEGGNDA